MKQKKKKRRIKRHHITDALQHRHWSPIKFCILSITYISAHGVNSIHLMMMFISIANK